MPFITSYGSRCAQKCRKVVEPTFELSKTATPARKTIVVVGDFVAESLDGGRGIVIPGEDVIIGAEQIAYFAPVLPSVIAQIYTKSQRIDVAQTVFTRAQIPIPEVLVDRVSDNGSRRNFTAAHFTCTYQFGMGI